MEFTSAALNQAAQSGTIFLPPGWAAGERLETRG
jgi:hypothetical protein